MMSEGLKLARNYKVLKGYVESSVIPPIQDSWLQNILGMIPKKLKTGKEEGLNQVLNEVRENFLESLKKSLARQTLKKPDLPQLENDDLVAAPEEPKNVNFSKPWHAEYVKHRKELVARLMILYPHMQKILDICQRFFGSMRLTEVKNYRELGAIDFENLRLAVQQEVADKTEYLTHKWQPRIFQLFSEKHSVPQLRSDALESFYNCVSTVLSIQLKHFLEKNLLEWVDLFDEEHTERLPVLKMYLTYEDQRVQFYPSFEDLEELILFIGDQITDSLQQIPTLKSWLNPNSGANFVDAKLPEHVLTKAQTKLRAAVRRYFEVPYQFFTKVFFEPYSFLLDGSEAKSVEEFLNGKRDFHEYKEYTAKLHTLGTEVMTLPNTEYFDLIRLDCEDVKVGLAKECRRLANALLERVVSDFKRTNDEICSGFEEMRDRCRATPQNSEELIAMIQYMEEARCQGMVRMEEKISWSREYLDYLLDVYHFKPEDIAQNSAVLTWRARIQPEFDANDKLQERMRAVGEAAVIARREKLATEMNRLRNRVDEFNDYGEMDSEMQAQYVQDVRAVLKRLMDAENERAWINKEEELYKLQVTNYPDIEEIRSLAEPFQRLFNTVVRYSKSERRWLHGEFDK
ncbi:Dynein heavy chain 7 axonemal [Fasciola gigantica]|uniref:Dynein heavy chain 7 axonemal n=1 Tax=Fasciola gigantica TaxID=46835 RepID=A0A504YMT2_FASGI|nr:Dynein heavy chain 7 axonemal [Fasciola gigantica]